MAGTANLNMKTNLARSLARYAMTAAVGLLCFGAVAQAQSVAVIVNGEVITNFDIDQRAKLNAISGQKSGRKEALEDLINDKVKIKEGKKFSVDPGSTEIDSAFANMAGRMRTTPEQFTQMLAARGIRVETFKARLKAEVVWNAIMRGRFKQSLQVSDREVDDAVRAAGGDPNAEAFEYLMRPIVLIVPRNSSTSLLETRRNEANRLREQIKSCEQADSTIKTTPNSTIRATVVKSSADLPPVLRDVLDKTPVGSLTPPEITRHGVEMVALCARRPTKVDTPKKREMREKLYQQRFEERAKRYLREIRASAMIEQRG